MVLTSAQSSIDPGYAWLTETASNEYSQLGEDGILGAIFHVIGAANKWCCECGAADGLFFSNTRKLIEEGWTGVLIEGNEGEFSRLVDNSKPFGDRVKLMHTFVDRERRFDDILRAFGAPADIDLMVIDVDGQDYFLWNSMLRYRPRVVVIEYDIMAEDQWFCPTLGGQGQAGEHAIHRLATGKLYDLVWMNRFNMVFVTRLASRLLLAVHKSG